MSAALVSEAAKRSPAFWSALGVASIDLDHGSHLIVAGHHGSGKHWLTDESDVLVGAAVVADVSAGAEGGMPAQQPFGGDGLIAFLGGVEHHVNDARDISFYSCERATIHALMSAVKARLEIASARPKQRQ